MEEVDKLNEVEGKKWNSLQANLTRLRCLGFSSATFVIEHTRELLKLSDNFQWLHEVHSQVVWVRMKADFSNQPGEAACQLSAIRRSLRRLLHMEKQKTLQRSQRIQSAP